MNNKLNSNNGIIVKTLIPCIYTYQYDERSRGYPQKNTCVGVFRYIDCFDFPSNGKNFTIVLFLDVLKGSYIVNMNIVDEKGSIIKTKDINEKICVDKNEHVTLCITFNNISFPKEGKYFFQLLTNNNIIYMYDFMVKKISRKDYTIDDIKNSLDGPNTIKAVSADLRCGICGNIKKFSKTLDQEKQNEKEKFPEEDIIKCERCGEEINIAEIRSEMSFYLGTNGITDTFNRNLNKSRKLAENGFLEESLVIQVTAFETFMRDNFKANYKDWFKNNFNEKNDLDANIKDMKRKIIDIIGKLNVKNKFYDQIFASVGTLFRI